MELKLMAVGDGRTAELPFGCVVIRARRMAGAGVMEVFTPDTSAALRCGMQLTLAADGNDIFSGYIFSLESSRFGRILTAADSVRYPDTSAALRCGMQLTLAADGNDIFSGYIFSLESSRFGRILTAADSVRYLLCRDTKVYTNMTAAAIVRDICGERGLKLGSAEDYGIVLPNLVADRQTLLDIISAACSETEKLGGGKLTLLDDAGKLCLMREESLDTGLTLTGENLISSCTVSSDIGTDTYNRIQLVRKNRRTGQREFFVQEDAASIARWGVLQYSETLPQNTTDLEINQRLSGLLAQKNRELTRLQLTAAGALLCRAGFLMRVSLPEMGIDGRFRILESEHRFTAGGYTMKLTASEQSEGGN